MPEQPGSTERLSALDLLRAVAILLVMLCHMQAEAVPAFLMPLHEFGSIGVDLFFVLSGYLIGSQLLKEYRLGGKPSVGAFYARRAFRILPAFLVVLGLYVLVPQFREWPAMLPAWRYLSFTMNLGFYWPEGGAFSHAWSLCVEEHFYLLFPIVCAALMHRPSLAATVRVALFVAAAGALVRLWSWTTFVDPVIAVPGGDVLVATYGEYIYYPTYTRLDGLLVGVILAAVRLFRPAWWDRAMAHGRELTLAGAVLTGSAVWLFSGPKSLPAAIFGYPLLSAGLGLLLASGLSADGLLGRLRIPGAALVATLAYSLYLTHKAVMHLDRLLLENLMPMEGAGAFLIYVGTSLAAASLLYLAVERPFLKLRDRLLPAGATGRQVEPGIAADWLVTVSSARRRSSVP